MNIKEHIGKALKIKDNLIKARKNNEQQGRQ